jgi:hypothetical protein
MSTYNMGANGKSGFMILAHIQKHFLSETWHVVLKLVKQTVLKTLLVIIYWFTPIWLWYVYIFNCSYGDYYKVTKYFFHMKINIYTHIRIKLCSVQYFPTMRGLLNVDLDLPLIEI